MHLNPLLPATATAALSALQPFSPSALCSDAPRPNIVLIISDQMSARALPIYGNHTIETPNMDRLVREGAVFDNSICTAPYCSPTRSSIVTGRYPVSTGIITNVALSKGNGAPSPKEILTESLLFDKGYATAHFGKWHLGNLNSWPCYADKKNARDMFDKTYFAGFSAQRAANHPSAAPAKPGEVLVKPKAEDGYGFYQTKYLYDKMQNAPQDVKKTVATIGRLGTPPDLYNWTLVTKDGTDFIEAHKDVPFMVTISVSPPHPDFQVPDPWYSRVDPAKIQFNPSSYLHPEHYLNDRVYKVGQYIGEEGSREKMRCYYAMITFVDDMIGRVLKTLDDCGIADNTLVVLISDHGDPLGTHGFLYGKSIPDFLEEALRVPTLMRLPGKIPAGKRVATTFSTVDLAPTIRDYAGVTTPPSDRPVQGRSFRPLLEGNQKDDATNIGFAVSQRQEARCVRGQIDGKIYIYSKMFHVAPNAGDSPTKSNAKGKAKAAAKAAAKGKTGAGNFYEELYNLTDDPYQLKDLIADPAYAQIKTRLQSEFNKYALVAGDRRIEDLPAKGLVPGGNFRNMPPDKNADDGDDE